MSEVNWDAGITLQQDVATFLTARMIQEWCLYNFRAFWPKALTPSSPELNPVDFGIRFKLEQKACIVSHPNMNSLKQKLTKYWEEIDPETVRDTCDQVVFRHRQVIKAREGYVK